MLHRMIVIVVTTQVVFIDHMISDIHVEMLFLSFGFLQLSEFPSTIVSISNIHSLQILARCSFILSFFTLSYISTGVQFAIIVNPYLQCNLTCTLTHLYYRSFIYKFTFYMRSQCWVLIAMSLMAHYLISSHYIQSYLYISQLNSLYYDSLRSRSLVHQVLTTVCNQQRKSQKPLVWVTDWKTILFALIS